MHRVSRIDINGDDILHNNNGPAIICIDGFIGWYVDGRPHRNDGPAIISKFGTKFWFCNGLLHNDFGPAIVYPDGTKVWYIQGQFCKIEGVTSRKKTS